MNSSTKTSPSISMSGSQLSISMSTWKLKLLWTGSKEATPLLATFNMTHPAPGLPAGSEGAPT